MDSKGITIERVFDLPSESVWKAWTEPSLTKKWWGPEGFTAPSIKINLKVGGKYIFAMRGPKGSQWDKVMYSSGVYKEIIPNEKLIVTDYFSDEKGNKIDPEKFGQDKNFPKETTVTVLFEKLKDNKTKLSIIYPKPETKEQMEAIVKSRMEEGWNSSLNKLLKIFDKKLNLEVKN